MKNFSRIFVLISLSLSLTSCAALQKMMNNKRLPAEPDYIEKGAKMDVKKFFNGELEGFSIIQGADGKISGTQTVKITSKWEEDKGVWTQVFTLNDGKKDSRTWLVTLNDDGTFDAVGHDVSVPATGKQIGNVAQMIYALSLPTKVEGRTVKEAVQYEDRMYLVDDKSMIMITEFRRNGTSGKIITSVKKLNDKN